MSLLKKIIHIILLAITPSIVLISCSLFASSPPDFTLASVYNEPSVYVEGKVNAITGELVDLEEDVVIQGAEPIHIQRAYLNTSRKDWIFLPHSEAVIDFSEAYQNCTIRETTGCPIRYKRVSEEKQHDRSIYRYQPEDLEAGFSNTSCSESLKNNYAIFDTKKHQLTLYTASGVERVYEKRRKKHNGLKGEIWRLLSEHLPNGNWLLYDYTKTNTKYSGPIFALSSIRSTNPAQTKQYAEARFIYEDPKKKNKHFFIEGSDGQRLEFRFDVQRERQSGYLNDVLSDACRPNQFYEYCMHRNQKDYWHFEPKERMIRAIIEPGNRRMEIDYYFKRWEKIDGTEVNLNEKDPESGKLADFIPDPRRGRVKMLSKSCGAEGQMVVAHTFFYDVENKKTSVYDYDKNLTEYYYDDQSRIQRLERYSNKKVLLNAEQFVWAQNGSANACNLLCKVFLDQDKKPIYAKRFFYDQKSNLIKETSYGNLSGKGGSLTLDGSLFPTEAGVETYSKEWRYSDGTPSLLLESKNDDGLRVIYEYLPKSNQPVQKFTYANGRIVARQFWVYNEDALLIREVVDDGRGSSIDDTSGCLVRTIRDYQLQKEQPYLGMPEVVEEKYWDGSSEKLLQKTVLHYTKAGRIDRKGVYDSTGTFQYSLHAEFDTHGRAKSETNPLGLTAYSQFDEVGNQMYFRDFSGRAEIFSTYDVNDLLTEKTFKGFDGLTRTHRYEYNTQHFLTKEIDPQGNITEYSPNLFGQSTETRLPPILGENNATLHPTLCADYDAAGNTILRIDAENFATKITYNAYGSPIEIIYPDQSKETFEYFHNGLLKSHTDQMLVVTTYERDPFGHITRKPFRKREKF
jgi:YD repeat-containing protein